MEQIGKDKTALQVFFSKTVGADDANVYIEFINDICFFLTIPSDMLAEHTIRKFETYPSCASAIRDIADACISVREDFPSKLYVDDLLMTLQKALGSVARLGQSDLSAPVTLICRLYTDTVAGRKGTP